MSDIVRLRKTWEFDLIFRTGVRVNGDLVRLLYLRSGDSDEIKFGCAVSKRLGKAHVRSRGRRILRAAFGQFSQRLLPGLQIILSLRERGLDSKTQDIARDIERLFRRKKLFKV
ncbi:MAG: ribonuclease P protein component [Synergistaceae bacterium]|nr:ribonuclease P protein component [Synergistaceae bacterium]